MNYKMKNVDISMLILLLILLIILMILVIIGSSIIKNWLNKNKCCKDTNKFKKCFSDTDITQYKKLCLIDEEGRCCGNKNCENINSFNQCMNNKLCTWQKSRNSCAV